MDSVFDRYIAAAAVSLWMILCVSIAGFGRLARSQNAAVLSIAS